MADENDKTAGEQTAGKAEPTEDEIKRASVPEPVVDTSNSGSSEESEDE